MGCKLSIKANRISLFEQSLSRTCFGILREMTFRHFRFDVNIFVSHIIPLNLPSKGEAGAAYNLIE